MKRIIKLGPLSVHQPFFLTDCSKAIHFGEQDGGLYVWVIEDLEKPKEEQHSYLIVATGATWEPNYIHEKTFITKQGLVWHLLRERTFLTDGAAIF